MDEQKAPSPVMSAADQHKLLEERKAMHQVIDILTGRGKFYMELRTKIAEEYRKQTNGQGPTDEMVDAGLQSLLHWCMEQHEEATKKLKKVRYIE